MPKLARPPEIEIGKRCPLNMRTTADLRSLLEQAAATTGRSLAQEVELRLERSFDRERAIAEADKRRTLSTRITERTRRNLEAAVAESGRSLSQEIELRLEASFERQQMIAEIIAAVRGLSP